MSRYSQKGQDERRAMLATIGVDSVDALFAAIPAAFRRREPLRLPAAMSEDRLLKLLSEMAAENADRRTCGKMRSIAARSPSGLPTGRASIISARVQQMTKAEASRRFAPCALCDRSDFAISRGSTCC